MEPEEVDFFDDHDSNPSSANIDTPPAQVEWQWEDEERDLVYNCHLVKEIYDNSRYDVDVEDPELAKRYNMMCFVYNKNNNLTGIVPDYCGTSEEFNEAADLDILENFIDNMQFLYDRDTEERKIYSFSRPSDFNH